MTEETFWENATNLALWFAVTSLSLLAGFGCLTAIVLLFKEVWL